MTNPLLQLAEAGQSIWIDHLDRKILGDGQLDRWIAEDGLKGMTSNPSIFEAAFSGEDYDEAIAILLRGEDKTPAQLYEALAITDIQAAADRFRPVYDRLEGDDGYVSLEVSPRLADDTAATVAEARRLWAAIDRPNVMIKVPGTQAGYAAIRQLVGEGININVTLLFGLDAYRAVAEAHLDGLEDLRARGGDLSRVRGVASFFVSRIDKAIDKAIDERFKTGVGQEAEMLRTLRGRVAIANAKMAYQAYLDMIGGARWKALAAAGAHPQRVLWASTSAKDPTYSDVLYVESLIGPETINTLPPKTLEAFRDHGRVSSTLMDELDVATTVLANADRLGLDLPGVTRQLLEDGVRQFVEAYDKLLLALAAKRDVLCSPNGSVGQGVKLTLGVVGLGRMGGDIARRLTSAGHRCVVYDQDSRATARSAADGASAAKDLRDLVAQLEAPRRVWLMLPAGAPTEDTVTALADLLEPGDLIIEGGNGFYRDDIRRARSLKAKGLDYIDAGVSGGVWGRERGYCLMVGGEAEAVARIEPLLHALAPGLGQIARTPRPAGADPRAELGYIHAGPVGAGHFVKMVHNGVEYGLMQAYAEGFDILRSRAGAALPEDECFDLNLADIAEVWRRGSVVSSWLLDLVARALAGDPTLEHYAGAVADSGEGRWTIEAAIEEQVPADALARALFARFRSREEHTFGEKLLSAMRYGFGGHVEKAGANGRSAAA